MGQRLVIVGKKDHIPIFNIYFHWSAYTSSSLDEADHLLKYLLQPEKCSDLVLSAIEYCEARGGGLSNDVDIEEVERIYPAHKIKTAGISRNNGLIAITADGMNQNLSWAEGVLEIDFDNDIINNNVFFYYDSVEQINEEYCYEGDDKIKDSDILNPYISVESFHFDKIDEVKEIIGDHTWIQGDGYILSTIE